MNAIGKALKHFGFNVAEPEATNFTSGQQQVDPLTGSQLATNKVLYQDAEVEGDEVLGMMTRPEDAPIEVRKFEWIRNLLGFDADDVANMDSNQFADGFKSLSTSDLSANQENSFIADLLPMATDPMAL